MGMSSFVLEEFLVDLGVIVWNEKDRLINDFLRKGLIRHRQNISSESFEKIMP